MSESVVRRDFPLADILSAAFDRARLGHALLLVPRSEDDVSFQQDLHSLVRRLTCPERVSGGEACGRCDSCRTLEPHFSTGSHPDVLCLRPESNGYSVEQARSLIGHFGLRRALGASRVLWLRQAEDLSAAQQAAGNALLKLIEEPRPDTFLILSSTQPQAMMATLRSRCQTFRLASFRQRQMRDVNAELNMERWQQLQAWLEAGAPSGQLAASPADDEAFWRDRSAAQVEFEAVCGELWQLMRGHWAKWNREASSRVLDCLLGLQEVRRAIEGYANPQLQWLNFKIRHGMGF